MTKLRVFFALLAVSWVSLSGVRADSLSASLDPGYQYYRPGGDTKSFYWKVHYPGVELSELSLTVTLPIGFTYSSASNYQAIEVIPEVTPASGAAGTLTFSYSNIPVDTAQFRMWLDYPAGLTDEHRLAASVSYRVNGSQEVRTLEIAPIVLVSEADRPVIVRHPNFSTAAQGQVATFAVAAASRYPVSYQWYLNGSPVAGDQGRVLTVTGTWQTQSVYVQVSSIAGSVSSRGVGLTVVPTPETAPAIGVQPSTVVARVGDVVDLSVQATGGDLRYQWKKHGFLLAGEVHHTLTISEPQLSDSGFYDVTVSNDFGTVTSQRVRLQVLPSADPGKLELDPDWTVSFERLGGELDTVATLADGGFVVAGNFVNVNGHATRTLVKFATSGSIDSEFKCEVELAGDVTDVVELTDGRLLVGGDFVANTPSGLRRGLIRLEADGRFDPSFRVTNVDVLRLDRFGVDGSGWIYARGLWKSGALGRTVFRVGSDGALDETYDPAATFAGEVDALLVRTNGEITLSTFESGTVTLRNFSSSGAPNWSRAATTFSRVHHLKTGPSGWTYAYGWAVGSINGQLRRFSATGEMDANFGHVDGYPIVYDFAVYPDGAAIVTSSIDVYTTDTAGGRAANLGFSPFAAALVARVAVDRDGRGVFIFSDGTRQAPVLRCQRVLRQFGVLMPGGPSHFTVRSRGIVAGIVAQADGHLVVAGEFDRVNGEAAGNLVRLNADGTIDATFESTGTDGIVTQLVQRADGGLLVGGGFTHVNGEARNGLALLTVEGGLDNTFVPPTVWPGFANADDLRELVDLPSGDLMVESRFVYPSQSSPALHLLRLTPPGLPVDAFNQSVHSLRAAWPVTDVVELTDGRIVVAGGKNSNNSEHLFWFNADGTPVAADNNPTLTLTTDILGAAGDAMDRVWFLSTAGIRRAANPGALDATLNENAESVADLPPSGFAKPVLLPQADGKLLVFSGLGLSSENRSGERRDFAVRLNENGRVDETFAVAGLWRVIETATQLGDGGLALATNGALRRTRTLQAPVPKAPSGGGRFSAGSSVVLSVTGTGAGATYQWYHDGEAIAGADEAILRLANLASSQAGIYTVVVSNELGSVESAGTMVALLPQFLVTGTQSVAAFSGDPTERSNFTVNNRITIEGNASTVTWVVVVPDGWMLRSATGPGASRQPIDDTTGIAEWEWTSPGAEPIEFSYELVASQSLRGVFEIAALIESTADGERFERMAAPDPLYLRRLGPEYHSADLDGDLRLSLSELLRVIELYNTRNGTARTGGYRVNYGTADMFDRDEERSIGTSVALERYHNADTNRDGTVALDELLRVISLYNVRHGTARTGGYQAAEGTVDGFAPADS